MALEQESMFSLMETRCLNLDLTRYKRNFPICKLLKINTLAPPKNVEYNYLSVAGRLAVFDTCTDTRACFNCTFERVHQPALRFAA